MEQPSTRQARAGLAAGDDGFVAPQLGDRTGDGAPVAVEERDDNPKGNRCPGKRVSIGCSGIVVEEPRRQAAVDAVHMAAGLLAHAATSGQCTEGAVGQYSTFTWCISASASRAW